MSPANDDAGVPEGAPARGVAARLGPLGIWSMELRNAPEAELRTAVGELDEMGWGALWIPGLSGSETLAVAATMLEATERTTVATGVLGVWNHRPEDLTAEHHRLERRHDGRLLTGLGVSNADSARKAGRDFPGAVPAMTAYLDELDALPEPIPASERLLGAMGPRMSQLAAERALGLHPFLVSPDYTREARTTLGPAPLIAPHQAVVLETDPARARAAARDGIGMFIGFPSYQANLRRLGFGDEDLAPGGSDRLIDAVVAWGSLEAIERRLREHLDAGADHVAMHVLAAPGGPPVETVWRELSTLIPSIVHNPR